MTYVFDFKTRFVGETKAFVEEQKYASTEDLCLRIKDWMTDELLLTATVCLPQLTPSPGHVFIKNYSENDGVLVSLQKAKVIGEVIAVHKAGYAEVYECEYLLPSVYRTEGE